MELPNIEPDHHHHDSHVQNSIQQQYKPYGYPQYISNPGYGLQQFTNPQFSSTNIDHPPDAIASNNPLDPTKHETEKDGRWAQTANQDAMPTGHTVLQRLAIHGVILVGPFFAGTLNSLPPLPSAVGVRS
jgi:hypothetical protein